MLADLDPVRGSEQGGTRPALIIQNDIGNQFSPVTIVAPITTKRYTIQHPTNVEITPKDSGLPEVSTILFNQIRTVDKSRIIKKIGKLQLALLPQINRAIKASLDVD